MHIVKPPFRADHVGSLLRPAALKDARARHKAGEISGDGLREIEDDAIREVIRKQEEIGLGSVTDGEFRRSWWHWDFLKQLNGAKLVEGGARQFNNVSTRAESVAVHGRISFPDAHPMIDHFRFLAKSTKNTPKMTLPGPNMLHFRLGANALRPVYPDMDEFFSDVGEAFRAAIHAFYDAGCRYLQLDDIAWAYLASPDHRAQLRERGDDPDRLPDRYARMMQIALSDKPADMIVTMHVCRGNYRSSWSATGGYERVAEKLFTDVPVDGYFLEYDSERAGGFEPLRFLPGGGKIAVLGLITSKTGELENRDEVKRRIDQAAKFVPLEQLALSPQCGFASTEEGNILAEEAQWAKLREVVAISRDVWG